MDPKITRKGKEKNQNKDKSAYKYGKSKEINDKNEMRFIIYYFQ